ncbi:hypothetical protein JNM87_06440 [Candidatus Saccharibacteria bacterium]|nr:hypothetical protein [Candidatus Saccharibacteria bacterium]
MIAKHFTKDLWDTENTIHERFSVVTDDETLATRVSVNTDHLHTCFEVGSLYRGRGLHFNDDGTLSTPSVDVTEGLGKLVRGEDNYRSYGELTVEPPILNPGKRQQIAHELAQLSLNIAATGVSQ